MVPNGWAKIRIDELGAVRGGRQRSPHFTKGEKHPYLRVANVFDGFIDTSDVNEMLFTHDEFIEYKLEPGDILLNEGQSIGLVGRCALYDGKPANCCFQNTLIRFRPLPDTDTQFVRYLFQHCQYSGKFAEIAVQTTSIAHLGTSRLAALRILIPPLTGDDARADTIAHRAIRTCIDHMQEDPAFYKRFSQLLQEAIDEFRAQRLQAIEYLKKVSDLAKQMIHRTDDDIPEVLRHRDVAKAYFGCVNAIITPLCNSGCVPAEVGAEAALAVEEIITRLRIVNWTANTDVQNQMRTEIEDALFDLKAKYGMDLAFEQMDGIIEECLKVAKVRVP
jgi:hypothetical protein